jgi:hypothetical protein
MSHSQFHSIKCLYLDMHGLIFETSIWLLAGSTRFLSLPADAHLRGYQPIEKRWGLLETRPFMRFHSAHYSIVFYTLVCALQSRTPGPSRYGFMSSWKLPVQEKAKASPCSFPLYQNSLFSSTVLVFPFPMQNNRNAEAFACLAQRSVEAWSSCRSICISLTGPPILPSRFAYRYLIR